MVCLLWVPLSKFPTESKNMSRAKQQVVGSGVNNAGENLKHCPIWAQLLLTLEAAVLANHTTVSSCRYCDGEVVIHWTNGHLVLNTHLLSLSKFRTLLRAFYTRRYIDDAKVWLYFSEVTVTPLFYHIRKLMTHKRVLRPMKPEPCVVSQNDFKETSPLLHYHSNGRHKRFEKIP